MTFPLTPIGDRIIVARIDSDEVTESGIIITKSSQNERIQQGKVLAIGPGNSHGDPKKMLNVGDNIYYDACLSVDSGTKVNEGPEITAKIIPLHAVLCVILPNVE